MKNDLVLKNRIKEFRKAQKLSQTELGNKIGLSQTSLSAIESGKSQPSAYWAGLICKALGCKFAECFYFEKTNT